MEKSQFNLCLEVLRRLEKAGILKDVILIGSWCTLFYKDHFSDVSYSPSIKTRDIDFLVPKPGAIGLHTDIPLLMKDLGFIQVKVQSLPVTMPHPANFALQKLIISQRRHDKDKSTKDREAAIGILRALIQKNEGNLIRDVFRSLPPKWQKAILKELKAAKETQVMELIGLS